MDADVTKSVRYRIGDAIAGFFLALLLSSTFGVFAQVAGFGTFVVFVASMLGLWVGLIASVLFVSAFRGSNDVRRDFGLVLRRSDVLPGFAIGVACQVVLMPVVYLLVGLFVDTSDLSDAAKGLVARQGQGWNIVPLAFGLIVIAPIVEELFYRGLVLRALTARMPLGAATVVSAVVFGGIHFQLLQFVGLSVFGYVLTHLANRTGRLGMSVFTHMGFNATTVVFIVVG